MRDRETGTLWSQVSGQGIHGPDAGQNLEMLPAVVTRWAEWKSAHPDTLVLRKQPLAGSPYADYFDSPGELGITGGSNPDARLPGKAIVLGVRVKGASVAYPPTAHLGEKFLNDEIAGEPVLVVFGSRVRLPLVYSRRLKNGSLMAMEWVEGHGPDARPLLRDSEGSLWDPLSGEAVEGPATGQRLQPLPAFTAYWFAWARFYPDTQVR